MKQNERKQMLQVRPGPYRKLLDLELTNQSLQN